MKKERITAVKKDNQNRIVEFKTNKNNIYNYEMAKEAITSGIIENASLIKGKDTLIHIVEKSDNGSINYFEKMEEF